MGKKCKVGAIGLLLIAAGFSTGLAQEGVESAETVVQAMERLQLMIDRVWIIVATALVFFMQAGFSCFEVGLVRAKNTKATAFKNLVDWMCISIVFSAFGYGLMFGPSVFGLFGFGNFFLTGIEDHPHGYIYFFFQLAFAGTALTIVSGAMAGRMSFISYLTGSLVVGAIIYPIVGHWVWGSGVYGDNSGILANLGFRDFAGSTVVHCVGAWVALVGVYMAGPRLGRYSDSEADQESFKPNNLAFTVLGTIILWFGWIGFNGGSHLTVDGKLGEILVVTNIAAAAAGFAAFAHSFYFQDRADLYEKMLGGILGGLVAITACCDVVNLTQAFILGILAGVVHNYSYDLIVKKFRLDDAVGAIPVHGFCGVLGTLYVCVGDTEVLGMSHFEQFFVQLFGAVVVFVWTGGLAFLMFNALKRTVGLRVSPDLEREGLDIIKEFDPPKQEDIDMSDEELLALLGGSAADLDGAGGAQPGSPAQ